MRQKQARVSSDVRGNAADGVATRACRTFVAAPPVETRVNCSGRVKRLMNCRPRAARRHVAEEAVVINRNRSVGGSGNRSVISLTLRVVSRVARESIMIDGNGACRRSRSYSNGNCSACGAAPPRLPRERFVNAAP